MILSIVVNRFETVASCHISIVLLYAKLARVRSMTDGSTVCAIELLLAASQPLTALRVTKLREEELLTVL